MTEKKWERLEPTFSLEDERLASLKQIVPEAFTDGKVDFEQLRALLGEAVEDESAEHFGLNWTGKREARRLAGMPSKGTLVPVPGKGLNEDTTENIFIEGDNLEVLKLLHKSYRGKIKMIYIDPPYNTGNDFIYKDDYRMPLESYLQRSGQKSDMGELLTSNPKSGGRFHSDWLNMMYPRLRVAKDLLRDDGVIFISIGDDEVANLRQLLNEIFGEENYLQVIVWKRHAGGGNDSRHFAIDHEYLLAFSKDKSAIKKLRLPLSESERAAYNKTDEHLDKLGPHKTKTFFRERPDDPREGLQYEIEAPDGTKLFGEWRWEEPKFLTAYKENRVLIRKDRNGNWKVEYKIYLLSDEDSDEEREKVPRSLLTDEERNSDGKKQLKALFNKENIFSNPKPLGLIKHLLRFGMGRDDLMLDFFAGSGTSAHAAMQLNIEDSGQRRFICVQLPERLDETQKDQKPAYNAGFRTISEITAERIRLAAEAINNEVDRSLLKDGEQQTGFSFFQLEHSTFKAWSDYQGNDLDELRGLLQGQIDSTFVDGATEDAILTEIILLEGFPLTSKIEVDETFQKNRVRRISHDWLEYRLFVTLDKEIQEETVRMAEDLEKIDIFICLDNALTDQDKLRLADVCRLKTI